MVKETTMAEEEVGAAITQGGNPVNNSKVDLTPRLVKEPAAIAKLWEKIDVRRGSFEIPRLRKDGFVEMNLAGTGIEKAMYALGKPGIKDIISVEAMVFPCVSIAQKVAADLRWYERLRFKPKDRTDLIPLAKNQRDYRDPWSDGKFPSFEGKTSGSEIIPQSCVLDDCPACDGEGTKLGKVFQGQKDRGWITCRHCDGTGKEGALLCDHCQGHGGWYSRSQVNQYATQQVKCDKCDGSGKLLAVLKAHKQVDTYEKFDLYMPNMEAYLPEPAIDWAVSEKKMGNGSSISIPKLSSIAGYRLIAEVKSDDGRCRIQKSDLATCESYAGDLIARIKSNQKSAEDSRAHYTNEKIRVEVCDRFVRFRIRFYVGPGYDHGPINEYGGCRGTTWPDQVKLPESYWTESLEGWKDYVTMVVWIDVVSGRAYAQEPDIKPDSKSVNLKRPADAFRAVLYRMVQSLGVSVSSNPKKKPSSKKPNVGGKSAKSQAKKVSNSAKKRWKFIILGLLFGWMGAHYMYAKRMFLLLSLWASFITGIVMIGSAQSDEERVSQDTSAEVAENSNTNDNEAIGGGCIALWALLWLGGTLFVKKDGNGNRM